MSDDKQIQAKFSYKILAQVIGLVSQEIYSRFTGMLVANSIIIAFIGLLITNELKFLPLSIILSVIGIILCIIWIFFNNHGIYWQGEYKKQAKKLEEENILSKDIKIWSHEPCYISYTHISTAIIIIFIIIYVSLLLTSIYLFLK